MTFVRRLVRDRLGVEIVPGNLGTPVGNEEHGLDFDDWQVRLIAAAAACNRAYFQDQVVSRGAVARSSSHRTAISDFDLWELPEVTLRELTAAIQTGAHVGHSAQNAIKTAIQILRNIDRTVKIGELQSLTELAWNELMGAVSDYGGYPDWQDFLNRLGQPNLGVGETASLSLESSPEIVRAALERENAESLTSWENTGGAQAVADLPRIGLYQNLAKLLIRQVKVRRRLIRLYESDRTAREQQFSKYLSEASTSRHGIPAKPKEGPTLLRGYPPPATIYVTTFDLEFELAHLTATRQEPQPFVIVAPIHIIDKLDNDPHSTTLWMGLVVHPTAEEEPVEIVRRIQGTQRNAHNGAPFDDALAAGWFFLSTVEQVGMGQLEDTHETHEAELEIELLRKALRLEQETTPQQCVEALFDLPLVVHLMGAPLVKPPVLEVPGWNLPKPTQHGRVALRMAGLAEAYERHHKELARGGGGPSSLVNAVSMTLLEEANAIRASLPEVIPGDSQTRRPPKNLPGELWHGFSDPYWRYWVMLGVELNDPVVRYRVLAQLLGDGLTRPQTESSRWPTGSGLTVNQRPLSGRANQSLRWCGFQGLDGGADDDAQSHPEPRLRKAVDHLRHLMGHLEGQIDDARFVIREGTCQLPQEWAQE